MATQAHPTRIRPVVPADLEAINHIYNGYVATSHVTFDLEPVSMARREEWLGEHQGDGPYRVLVAVEDGSILGWAASSRLRPKPGYATSVETSVYVAPDAQGCGLGTRLYLALFDALAGLDLHRAYAGIALPNPASVRLHERVGFRRVALFTQQGRKFGRYWDVAWFERPLPGPA